MRACASVPTACIHRACTCSVQRTSSAQAVHCKQFTHGMRTHVSALPGAESTPPRRKPHGSAMTPQPTQIFASVTADAPTEPTPSFSRVRSASLLDIYLRKVDGKRGRVERHCRSMVARTACRHSATMYALKQKLAHRGARADQAPYIFDLLLYYSLLLHRNPHESVAAPPRAHLSCCVYEGEQRVCSPSGVLAAVCSHALTSMRSMKASCYSMMLVTARSTGSPWWFR